MALKNFDVIQGGHVVKVRSSVIKQTVTVVPHLSQGRSHLTKPPAAWTWEELRDYVVHQIEMLFGPFPRDILREAGIFKSFITRWGPEGAAAIAQHAFEHHNGRWSNAPISVNRFCKGSDPFFAEVIAQKLGIIKPE